MMNSTWLALVLATLGAIAAGAAQAADVPDKQVPLPPSQLQLSGWLGQRVEANWKHRLLTINLDERLRPLKRPTEAGGWSGEHIGKWLHASCLAWQYSHDERLRARILEATASLISCQGADGYLGTYAKDKRWIGWDVWTHKYNLIGLLSVYDTFQKPEALAAARKIGDLLAATFGDGPGQRDIIRAGEHVGMAATSVLEPIVLLYRDTRDPRYLHFARYILRSYDQPHGPKIVASLTTHGSVEKTANGKAYEMMSNLVGLCELYRVTGDAACLKACRNAYADIVANRMYLTGGTSLGEHFQADHHLPNVGAVSENCAQVTWLQLCLELLRLTGEAKYADTLERDRLQPLAGRAVARRPVAVLLHAAGGQKALRSGLQLLHVQRSPGHRAADHLRLHDGAGGRDREPLRAFHGPARAGRRAHEDHPADPLSAGRQSPADGRPGAAGAARIASADPGLVQKLSSRPEGQAQRGREPGRRLPDHFAPMAEGGHGRD